MKIVVDSACDLDEKLLEKLDVEIEIVPFNLLLDDKTYVDDDLLDVDAFIDAMVKSDVVKTSAPSPELFLDTYLGEESVFVITISQKLSASYNSALVAKQMYLDEYDEKFIHVFDSKTAAAGETALAIKLAECVKSGMKEEEIVKEIDNFIGGMETYFALERYDNLVKNGRMSSMVAKAASILTIKPISAAVDGKPEMVDKAMGTQKAMKKLVDLVASGNKEEMKKRTLAITHVRCIEKAEYLKEEIGKKAEFKDIVIVETAGLCSTYADDQGIVVAY